MIFTKFRLAYIYIYPLRTVFIIQQKFFFICFSRYRNRKQRFHSCTSEIKACQSAALAELEMAMNDTDMNIVPAGEGSSAAGPSNTTPQSSKKSKKFEIKKWNAVSLWAWGIVLLLLLICDAYRFVYMRVGFCSEFFMLLGSITLIFTVADIVVDNCAICRNHIMDLCMSLFLLFILIYKKIASV